MLNISTSDEKCEKKEGKRKKPGGSDQLNRLTLGGRIVRLQEKKNEFL